MRHPERITQAKRRITARALLIFLTVWAVVTGLIVAVNGPAKAQAAPEGAGVAITEMKFTTNRDIVTQWEYGTLSAQWRSLGEVKAGESFTMTLPNELKLHDALSFDLVSTGGEVGATCSAPPGQASVLTCTFNEAFENKDQVQGTIVIESIQIAEQVPTGEVTVTAPNESGAYVDRSIQIFRPSGEQVEAVGPQVHPVHAGAQKSAWEQDKRNTHDPYRIVWAVTPGTDDLKDFDAAGVDRVVLTEELTGAHVFDSESLDKDALYLAADGYKYVGELLEVELDPANPKKATFTLTKPQGVGLLIKTARLTCAFST